MGKNKEHDVDFFREWGLGLGVASLDCLPSTR